MKIENFIKEIVAMVAASSSVSQVATQLNEKSTIVATTLYPQG